MKTASSTMQQHLLSDCTTTARLYKITRKDGTVFCFTDHDKDISTKGFEAYFTDQNPSTGGYVYQAAVGLFFPTAIENKSDLSVDNQEVTAVIDSVQIKENDLRFGVWDSADVEIRLCNWADLTQGEVKLRKGYLGDITMKNGLLTASVYGLTNYLQVLQGRSFGPQCDAEFGDTRCKYVVPTETGTVNGNPSIGLNDSHHVTPYSGLNGQAGGPTQIVLTGTFLVNNGSGVSATGQGGFCSYTGGTCQITDASASAGQVTYSFIVLTGIAPVGGQSVVITGMQDTGNNGTFTLLSVTATSFAVRAGYYQDGIITFSSGNNSGLSFQVKYWDGVTLTLCSALFAACADGDAFTISPGCDHSISTCHSKFNNVDNFRGFPSMPGQDAIMQYPDVTG
jgi:uncharacterized phage protein (TIGR02218 family)